ncbi:transcriptional regulator [Duffyella gerundensis]|jgi:putative transcriptional regulator|uniref:HTH cro/C1-type domain-containing protein n=1 Tax=Duffyella gerundensis TaxID=1619313 RepID=A0A0U5L8Z4_9GAMM|nr:HTH-type transcriptional regulator [Duffyella gerundensis]QTO54373.1 HTH-type transcriptional regulator [Duffyella gerundensis]UCB29573.1 transcriptional regulator [Duffyella gerundensis]CUU25611.1 hypothetical protein EM595_3380 [Duffyella gerundensis]
MEFKDPMGELLSSLEQIVLSRDTIKVAPALQAQPEIVPEPQRLRELTGMKIDEFARVMGVTVSSVKKWETSQSKPSATARKLMQLLHANPRLGQQLLE